jgi:hypothetical protein
MGGCSPFLNLLTDSLRGMMPRLALPRNRVPAPDRVRAPQAVRDALAERPDLEARALAALEARRGKAQFRGPPKAGALAAKIIKPLIPPGAASLTDLKRQWSEIVGEKLAQVTAPDKLTRGADGLVLTLLVAGSAAPFIQHQTPLILERLRLAGAGVTGLTMKQGAVAPKAMANLRPLSQPLSAEAEKALKVALAPIDDDRLKSALLRLGRAMGTAKTR